ncbi:MAG: major capsid protein [Pseudobdellovibrionaceae bacterium]|nr:major capsid protein [Pseudobdellovibrionaceae bacterium]
MALPIYGTYYLNRLITRIVPKPRFFLDRFFPTEVQSTKEEIYFDEAPGTKTGIAPFVHPLVEAPMFREQGYRTKSLRPAYIKEKTGLTPDRGFVRMAGEAFGGELTPMQRLEILLTRDVTRLQDRWRNRLELMAAEVVKTGKLTIKGDGLDAVLDFERAASLTKKLPVDKVWTKKDLPMRVFFEGIQREVASLNHTQSRPVNVIMGVEAYDLFAANDEIKGLLSELIKGAELEIQITPGLQSFESMVYKGRFGNTRIWVYEAVSDDGKPYIEPKQALFHCNDIQGVQFFGAIQDLDAELQALKTFMKSWKVEDPSQRIVLLQSAPILATFDPNTACLVTVA